MCKAYQFSNNGIRETSGKPTQDHMVGTFEPHILSSDSVSMYPPPAASDNLSNLFLISFDRT